MFASARGAKYCVCAAVTASTFGSSVTILKVTDVTDVTDVIAGSSVGGRSEYGRAVTHGRAGANGSDMGGVCRAAVVDLHRFCHIWVVPGNLV